MLQRKQLQVPEKTLAFLIPLLEILLRRSRTQTWGKQEVGAIVISPTRELALQTYDVLKQLLKYVKGLRQILFVGGNHVEEDVDNFIKNGGNILICTPGRLEDLLCRKQEINLPLAVKHLELLILDEADRLLDLGFKTTLDTILSYLPKQRRTGLFSATQTKELDALIRAGLRNPVVVNVTEKVTQSTPILLKNYYIVVENNGKLATLLNFLEKELVKKAIIFFPTCACVDYWSSVFSSILPKSIKVPVLALHGKMKEKRSKILERFRTSTEALLLCTDVMARGIDIPEITKLRDTLRQLQLKDRALMEKATRAFVSHIRAYSKHECSLLLRIKDLSIGAMAATYGLLQLPKMPELKNKDSSDFPIVENFDFNAVPYKDKDREAARQLKLKQYENTGIWPGHKQKNKPRMKSSEPWSKTKQKKEEKKEKRLKRKRGKDAKISKNEPVKKKKRKNPISQEDMEELSRDIALLKKLKKKKITEEEFDEAFEKI
ncbi:rna helicase [Holotrichia oblita]|uniref:Rna helicase n=1 Tax=Holotrichia oblita TaxID=644536 RepID=A0ACB9SN40_HOLOL|nr:rna helicase [Holotrichia oblita]